MFLRFVTLIPFLFVVACSSTKPPQFTRLNDRDIAPLVKEAEENGLQPRETVFYDLMVLESDGSVISQSDDNPYAQAPYRIDATRVLKFGHGSSRGGGKFGVQTTTGLWEDPHFKRWRARLFVNIHWDEKFGETPSDLSGATSDALLTCEQWALALSIDRQHPEELAKVLDKNGVSKNIPGRVAVPPYRLGQFWIVPVEIRLPGKGFSGNCL